MFPARSQFIKNEFARLNEICYLDNAGSALYADSQLNNVMKDLKTHLYGNPHSTGDHSTACEELIANIRYKILKHFNTGQEKYSVIFTSGATGALKTIAECFAWNDNNDDNQLKNADGQYLGSTFAYTDDNHTSVLGMRESAPVVTNLLCLTRDKAYEALDNKIPLSNEKMHYTADSRNSLFAYPAQSNFSGTKYPLKWIEACRLGALDQYTGDRVKSKWYIVLDASSYVSTNYLDLNKYTPDFVTISFYKMFGYPTGLGALLVHKGTGAAVLSKKTYFGGGTVEIVLAHNRHYVFKKKLHEKFEDGTLDFLSIIAVGHGLDTLHQLAGPMRVIADRTFGLAAYLYDRMNRTRHGNGCPMFCIYSDTVYRCKKTQGGIINFNVLRANGDYVGYNEVNNIANTHRIVLRVGCFCNPGACQTHLGHTDQELRQNQEVKGHICGDHIDLVDGRPTGSVRVSFGYHSNKSDADILYNTLVKEFWQNNPVKSVNRPRLTVDEYDKMDLRVSRIFVYPIKSCGVFEINEWQLESYGFLYDRNWAVVSDSGICMTQLQEPKLCLVQPRIDLEKGIMVLVYAGNEDEEPMTVPLDMNYDNVVNKSGNICWGGSVEGIDCGDKVATWLSWNIDRPGLRLIRCTTRNPPDVNNYGNLDPKVLASNQCQYLLATESTLKWLQKEMENDITEIDEDNLLFRFRCNIVISGNNIPPFAEITWEKLDIGGVIFQFDSVCERCKMVNIDQDTSENYYKPLTILAQHKQQGKTIFGIYLKCDSNMDKLKIRVGQKCVINRSN